MQELKDLLKILIKYKLFLIVPTLIAGVGAFVFTLSSPVFYQALSTLYVYRAEQSSSEKFYTYEGYYSQQASKEYTDVVIGLLKSPDLARLGLEKASLDNSNPGYLLGSLKVKKAAPQLISVSVSKESSEESRKLLVALTAAVGERTQSLNKEAGRGVVVAAVKEEPLIVKEEKPVVLNTAVGVLAGLILGFISIFTIVYLKKD